MFVQKVPHIKDQFLTQERASMELESGQIAVGWYTNEQDSQSVVHSHPYYELVLPLVGSNVRYSVDGNIYDINLGEMIIFPARCYHAGMFNITDKISERLIAQISAELWQEALLASGLVAPTWLGQLVILDADAVTAWDLRGLFERMAQTAYLHGSTQHMVQRRHKIRHFSAEIHIQPALCFGQGRGFALRALRGQARRIILCAVKPQAGQAHFIRCQQNFPQGGLIMRGEHHNIYPFCCTFDVFSVWEPAGAAFLAGAFFLGA